MYPSDKALQRPEVKAFMEFVVKNQAAIAKASKIVSMTDTQGAESKQGGRPARRRRPARWTEQFSRFSVFFPFGAFARRGSESRCR